MSPSAPPSGATSVRTRREVALRRLAATGLAPATGLPGPDPTAAIADAVSGHVALQAQDLASGLWSVGARTGATAAEVLAALEARAVTRSWPMRGTLHLMATRDVRWVCELLGGRGIAAARTRLAQLGLADEVDRAREVLVAALSGGAALTRTEAYAALAAGGVDPTGQRGIHLLGRFCQEALLCQGPPRGTQPTFVLLDEWAPTSWLPGREEAMATLAERYVRSHGPVRETDLAGWLGQTLAFTREAVTLAGDRLVVERIAGVDHLVHVDAPAAGPPGQVLLLPGFDEYLLGYKDRSAVLTRAEERVVVPGGNGVFLPTVVNGGLVVGTWSRRVGPTRVDVTVRPWRALGADPRRRLHRAVEAYGRFLDLPARVLWADDRPGVCAASGADERRGP